jgi:hypothetical protein
MKFSRHLLDVLFVLLCPLPNKPFSIRLGHVHHGGNWKTNDKKEMLFCQKLYFLAPLILHISVHIIVKNEQHDNFK